MAVAAACVAAGAVASAMYIDAKLQLSDDLRNEWRLAEGQKNLQRATAEGRLSTFDLFEKVAKETPNAEAIWTRAQQYTWKDAYDRVCQFAHYFAEKGVKPGDFVALYLLNQAEFMFCWLGLHAIGAAPALINHNLSGPALEHCLRISRTQMVVVDADAACRDRFGSSGKSFGLTTIILDSDAKAEISLYSREPPDISLRQKKTPLGLMYTSGTTGLPKAFPVGVERAYCTASVRRKTFGQRPGANGDRSYYAIPFYHGTGGIAAIIDLCGGLPIAIAPKFSVSMFWQDCVDSQATIAMYVGETARYLLAAPPSPLDRAHRVRMIWGNGMSPGVWKRFQQRFGVTEIGEFFASTEGMLTLVNFSRNDLSVGAVGHEGWRVRRQNRGARISVLLDQDTGDIWRHPRTQLAKETSLDEGGEILIRIESRAAWPGYWDAPDQSEKRFVSNVLTQGDLWYRTGDALRRNADGYWYFLDRLGDTFRWKGENVSTTEVSERLSNCPCVTDVNVYGVRVPNHEGRSGCAAVVIAPGSELSWTKDLLARAQATLPKYAVPLFIRCLRDSADMRTGNNKHIKGPFQAEGIDVASFGQKVANGADHQMYWLKPGSDSYELFTKEDLLRLETGTAKL